MMKVLDQYTIAMMRLNMKTDPSRKKQNHYHHRVHLDHTIAPFLLLMSMIKSEHFSFDNFHIYVRDGQSIISPFITLNL